MTLFTSSPHSEFSFDSTEPLSRYLQAHPNAPVVATEQLDFHNPVAHFRNNVPNYAKYCRTLTTLQKRYGVRLYRGVEIGYTAAAEAKIIAYLDRHPFDLRLLAVHQNGQFDFTQRTVLQLPVAEVVREYLQLIIDALESPVPADVLAHFDYGLRQLTLTPAELDHYAGDRLDRMLALVCQRGLALELNTKSMYHYGNVALYDALITRYLAHGGHRFSIGSDAHQLSGYASQFAAARRLLLQHGVTTITRFTDHPETVSLVNGARTA